MISFGYKYCKHCKFILPNNFFPNARAAECFNCRESLYGDRYSIKPILQPISYEQADMASIYGYALQKTPKKTCEICGELKDSNYFYLATSQPDNLFPVCIQCLMDKSININKEKIT